MARLAASENESPSNSISPPITPISQSPIISNRNQSPFDTQMDDKLSHSNSSNDLKQISDVRPHVLDNNGVFKEPTKPIDINLPSTSSKNHRAPPQRSDSETSSTHMEVDEPNGSADKMGTNTDIDSGFENMEVDESDVQRKDVNRQRTSSSSTELSEEQLQTIVAKILHVNFHANNDTNRLYVPETADWLKQQHNSPTIRDLCSNGIMEILNRIANGDNPFKTLLTNAESTDNISVNSFSVSPPQNLSPSPSPVTGQCPIPTLTMPQNDSNLTPTMIALNFLMESYNRVGVQERNHPKRSSIPPLSDVLTEIRAQLVQYTTLVVQGFVVPLKDDKESPLLQPILQQTIPRGFLSELVTRTYTDVELFSKVFSPILQALFKMMQNASILDENRRIPLETLFELADIRCGSRPICTLITKQVRNFFFEKKC